jgi:hypothetical protein
MNVKSIREDKENFNKTTYKYSIPLQVKRKISSIDSGIEYFLKIVYTVPKICDLYGSYDEFIQVVSDTVAERMYNYHFSDLDDMSEEWEKIYHGIMDYIDITWGDRLEEYFENGCNKENVLKEEYNLPAQVRRRVNLSDDNIILLLRDRLLREPFIKRRKFNIEDELSEVAYGMMHDAGIYDTEYYTKEIQNAIRDYLIDNFGEYGQNFHDELYNGDDDERYIFYKHADRNGGNGFTEGITGWYNFLHKYGYWFPMIDWPEVKEKLKSMLRGQKLLLSSPGDSNNGDWGYYFSISMK